MLKSKVYHKLMFYSNTAYYYENIKKNKLKNLQTSNF